MSCARSADRVTAATTRCACRAFPIAARRPKTGSGPSSAWSCSITHRSIPRTRAVQTEPGADGRPADNRHPMDKAIEHLSKTLPLNTSEWSAWSAAMQSPKLAGRWAVIGAMTGKGAVYGQLTIAADPSAPDSFTTETRYTLARTGETVSRSGKALVYTGYQWRGREGDWRQVMLVERDWKNMSGRWFTGAYDETGVDVKLVRIGAEPVVFGTSVSALKTSSSAQAVKIFGANLP